MSTKEHKSRAPRSVGCAVITVSDSRSESTDETGRYILEALVGEGHEAHSYRVVADELQDIRRALEEAASARGVRAVLVNGGTGVSRRDTTYEAVSGMLDKRLDGFGELFRMLSYQEIGSAAMMSRAVAGTFGEVAVFAMPGSPAAARLAMERLILPELGHLAFELQKGPETEGR